ncbi:MAG: hypothetical protein IJQ99_02210 [Synergistaceae bacterium]|nr:hypothetical protein [bacterium]MBR0315662.1 hypothetical protein [Synergistaceae bacterium]
MPKVKQERTGWRDEGLSLRHRQWGFDCPMTDIDFLALEYDTGKAKAIVEYKNEHAQLQYPSHPSYRALIDLGNRAELPVFACRYSDDFSKYKVTALNFHASKFCPVPAELTEREWVSMLYKIRDREI